MDELGQLQEEDYQRQDIIERAGWPVHRISGRRWLLNPEREIELTLEALGRQPTRATLETLMGPTPRGDAAPAESGPAAPEASAEVAVEPKGQETAAEESPAEGAEKDHDDLGPEGRCIHNLIHWIVLRPQVEWSVVDRLDEILQLHKGGVSLMPAQRALARQALEWAVKLGFDPGEDCEGLGQEAPAAS